MGKTTRVKLPTLHPGQVRAFWANQPSKRQLDLDPAFVNNAGGRFKAIRCGRRWGKTDFIKTWIGDGALRGEPCAIFAPDYKRMSEVYVEMATMLAPRVPKQGGANKTDGVIRLEGGGRIDFWTLSDESAGRSRRYKRVAIDESAFTNANMMDIWKRSIQPTLLDFRGNCITASNTNGIDPENFLWQVCNQAEHQFIEVHEPSWNNPYVPGRLLEHEMPTQMSPLDPEWPALKATLDALHEADRMAYFDDLRARTPPLVFAQEYESEFVDWSGAAFFSKDKWLDEAGQPVDMPVHCDTVFAVIDSAVKTGTDNDGTAVTYFARNKYAGQPLYILDYDIVQIEGAMLDTWLETVLSNLEHYAQVCRAREGVRGVWIEDKSSGMVLLQQARKRNMPVFPIGGAWMQLGKDERAISVSSYHYQGKCKITREADNKVMLYKGTNRNHLIGQVMGFRIGDKDAAKRADDLLDTYVHGLALTFGDNKQF